MNNIYLPIDQKSLYLNILNDNSVGHTPTVATPIKQGKSFNDALARVFDLINNEIDVAKYPDLVSEMLKNSKSTNVIKNAYVFDKIAINNQIVDVDSEFCIFVKEEIDPQKKQFGRIKLHYPTSLSYKDESLNIDNRTILKAISEKIKNYAFIVNAFIYDFATGILNFDVLIVGENNIPYSKVFMNNKGVGSKLSKAFANVFDNYNYEILKLRHFFGEDVSPANYSEYECKMKEDAFKLIKQHFCEQGIQIENISSDYPYSLYDFRYKKDGYYQYGILRVTATKQLYFDLPMNQREFINSFDNCAKVYVITDLFENKEIHILTKKQIMSMNMQINSIKYLGEEFDGENN